MPQVIVKKRKVKEATEGLERSRRLAKQVHSPLYLSSSANTGKFLKFRISARCQGNAFHPQLPRSGLLARNGFRLARYPGIVTSVRKKSASRAASPEAPIVSVRLLLALQRRAYRRIYANVASNARHWAIREATSSGVRNITDRSHDACISRALSSLPPVFAASV